MNSLQKKLNTRLSIRITHSRIRKDLNNDDSIAIVDYPQIIIHLISLITTLNDFKNKKNIN